MFHKIAPGIVVVASGVKAHRSIYHFVLFFFSSKKTSYFLNIKWRNHFFTLRILTKKYLKQRTTLNKMLTQKGELWLNGFSGYLALNKKIHLVSIFVKNIHTISE